MSTKKICKESAYVNTIPKNTVYVGKSLKEIHCTGKTCAELGSFNRPVESLTQAFQLVLDKKMEMVNVQVAAGDYSDTDTSIEIPPQIRQIQGSGKNVTFIGNNIMITSSVDIKDITIGNDPNKNAVSMELDNAVSKSSNFDKKLVSFLQTNFTGNIITKVTNSGVLSKANPSPCQAKQAQASNPFLWGAEYSHTEQATNGKNTTLVGTSASFDMSTDDSMWVFPFSETKSTSISLPWISAVVEPRAVFNFNSSQTKHEGFEKVIDLNNDGGLVNISIIRARVKKFRYNRKNTPNESFGGALYQSATTNRGTTTTTINGLTAPSYPMLLSSSDETSTSDFLVSTSEAAALGETWVALPGDSANPAIKTALIPSAPIELTVTNSSFGLPFVEASSNRFHNTNLTLNGCSMNGHKMEFIGSTVNCTDCKMFNCPMDCTNSGISCNTLNHTSDNECNVTMSGASNLLVNGSSFDNKAKKPIFHHKGGGHTTTITQSSLATSSKAVIDFDSGNQKTLEQVAPTRLQVGAVNCSGLYKHFAQNCCTAPVTFLNATNQNIVGANTVVGKFAFQTTSDAFDAADA